MINLWIRANEANLLYRILAPSEAGRRETCTQFLRDTISGANTTVMKAVDWKDGSVITAFGVWGRMYPCKTDSNEDVNYERMGGQGVMGGMLVASTDSEKTPLKKYLAAQQEVINNTSAKDVKYVELMVLVTDPAYQRKRYQVRVD